MKDLGVYTKNWFDSGNWKEIILLGTALNAGIFECLQNGQKTAEEISDDLDLDLRALRMFLLALAELKYLSSRNGYFRITSKSRMYFLDTKSKYYLRNSILHSVRLIERWMTMPSVLKDGKIKGGDRRTEGVEGFIFAMNEQARRSVSEVVKKVTPYLKGAESLVDIGGGGGIFSREFKKKIKNVSLFDNPDVIDVLRNNGQGLDNVGLLAGDILAGPTPDKFDAAFFSNVSHIFGPDQNARIFENISASLNPGGFCVLIDFVIGKNKSAPFFGLNMLVNNPHGSTYSESEYLDWMTAAGFTKRAGFCLSDRDEYVLIGSLPR